jgi:hypothetical protein
VAGQAALETLLRQFEYEAGLPAVGGRPAAGSRPAIEVAWLRSELGMDGGPED